MPRGYRCIIVAAFGWLVLSAANPKTENTQSKASSKQAGATVTAERPYSPYPNLNADACYKAKDHDAADLCAQWRAAIAAEKTAREAQRATTWSIIAAFLSFATVIGLIVTIWQTFGALGEARRGNRLAMKANARATRQAIASAADTKAALATAERQANVAEDTAARQLRAYVISFDHEVDDFAIGRLPVFRAKMKNFGQTPANEVRMIYGLAVTVGDPDIHRMRLRVEGKVSSSTIGPSDFHVAEFRGEKRLTDVDIRAMLAGTIILFAGITSYRDVFGKRHLSTFRYFFSLSEDDLPGSKFDLAACATGTKAN